MKYGQTEFMRLMEAIEADGGEHLDEVCEHRYVERFTGPVKLPESEHILPMCGAPAKFKIPYRASDKEGKEQGVAPIHVCAVDDMIGRWPRFADANAPGVE